MALTYRTTLPRVAAGLTVEIVDRHTGDVTSVSDGPSADPNGDGLVYRVELAEGDYYSRAKNADGRVLYSSAVELDEAASIAAGGGGSAETAYLVALGVAGLTDENSTHAPLIADDRCGDLPSWCTLTDGNVSLGEDAGSVAVAALDVCSLDFSGTTVPDAPGCINARVTVKVNTVQASAGDPDLAQVTSQDTTAAADGQDIQTVRPMAIDQTGGGELWFFVSAKATTTNAFTDPISDGVASHDLYVALTKEAPGPVPLP